jgi:[calcium/calmodulin-dependent protein kinase] kinase
MMFEQVAKIIFKQVAEGIEYLFSEMVAHRDIKIDNIICSSECNKLFKNF